MTISTPPSAPSTTTTTPTKKTTASEGTAKNSTENVTKLTLPSEPTSTLPKGKFPGVKTGSFSAVGNELVLNLHDVLVPVNGLTLELDPANKKLIFTVRYLDEEDEETTDRKTYQLPAPATDATAELNSKTGDLVIKIKNSAGSGGTSGEVEVSNLLLAKNPSSAATRVQVHTGQSGSTFVFTLEPSKYDTNVRAVLEGRNLTFNLQHTESAIDEDGDEVEKTIKAKQAITFPIDVSPQNFQVINESNGNLTLKVSQDIKSGSATSNSATRVIPIKSI
eukprot:TRINITY_DN4219_c0_g3_i2.p1 TRINITY_DN4219_c0_g3~~TRINITY_DN4219_c0_g3_i2.p1  ORF type:complete len:278 (+),score=63.48 TRINITY_DN4219_c0_g3_i2:654-1487(+)